MNNPLRYIDPTGNTAWDSGWGFSSIFDTGRDFWIGSNPSGFKSGVYNSIVGTSSAIFATSILPASLLALPAVNYTISTLGILGSASTGFISGMALTGRDITGKPLSEYQRKEYAAAGILGFAGLGLAASEQYKNLGSLFSLREKTNYIGQGGILALGRFEGNSPRPGLVALADKYNARILTNSPPKGVSLPQFLRGEINTADDIYMRMEDVYPGTITNDIELNYIRNNAELASKTRLVYDE